MPYRTHSYPTMKKSIYVALLFLSLTSFGCLDKVMKTKVSDEILKVFISHDQALEVASESLQAKNNSTKTAIIAKVQEEMDQGNEKHAHFLPQIDDISERTHSMLNHLDGLKQSLKEFAEFDAETGELEFPDEVDRSTAFMMGIDPEANEGSGNGEGIQLRKRLEAYVGQANSWMILESEGIEPSPVDPLEPIVVLPKEGAYLPENEPKNASLSWEAYTFAWKPAVATMAKMASFKLEVLEGEAEQLDFLRNQLGVISCWVDSLVAVNSPKK